MENILTRNMAFIDEFGRERIFNGVNICDKEYYSLLSDGYSYINREIIEQLYMLGFNVIRLGLTWATYEPEMNKFNDKVINKVIEFLDLCSEYGIYVYLDMHQDLYSSFGSRRNPGDGAPEWATINDGIKRGKTHLVWAEGYFFDKAVHRAFDNFWENKTVSDKGLLEHYAACWKHIVSKVKDHPALLGYDVLNEPFPGKNGGKVFKKLISGAVKVIATDREFNRTQAVKSVFTKKGFVLDSASGNVLKKVTNGSNDLIKDFDLNRYSPFLNKMAETIRGETDTGIVFIENCYYSNLGIPCSTPPIAVKGKREPLQCFSPHAYDIMVDTPEYKYANNDRVGSIFAEHRRTQKRLNVPVLVGEWGGSAEGIDWLQHIEFLLDIFDKNKWSNTYWAFNHTMLKKPIMNLLSRPYPRAVTGEIIKYSYSRITRKFALEYIQDKDFGKPTVIYVSSKPQKIVTNGEYSIETIGNNGQCVVKLFTNIGKNSIEIYI